MRNLGLKIVTSSMRSSSAADLIIVGRVSSHLTKSKTVHAYFCVILLISDTAQIWNCSMAENGHLSDNEEFLSPVKNEPSDRECTPPPRQKKHRIKRRLTHQATCPKNPSRRLVFSSHDERDPSPVRQCKKKKRKMKRKKSGRSKKQKFEGRDIEVSGTWVQCTNKDCMKWRYLSDITDPSHVPDIWTCEMNSDSSYNSCLLPEQDYSTLEFVHAKFTEGSLVWAKMPGFPWWPAMIEEDPDSELCLYPDPVTGYVTDYHVVFLDKKVTRCWVKVSNILKYESGDCPGSMIVKGHDYSQKIMAAKETANEAQKLPIQERIKMYGFSAHFKGPWGEEVERTSDESQQTEPLKKKGLQPKKRVIIDEDSSLAESLLSHSDMDDILDEAEVLLEEVQNIVMEVEDEVQQNLLQEMETGEKGSPPQKRRAEGDDIDEPPTKQKKDTCMPKEKDWGSSSKQDIERVEKVPKGKQNSELKRSKELKRIQKKKEKEMHKLELREMKEQERIERREKEKQAKKNQRAREKQEKEETRQKEKQEEKERKEKEKQEEKERKETEKQAQKEKTKEEKKELKRKQKEAKKELKKKEKAEKKALKKALEGGTGVSSEGKEIEDDAEKVARKEKKRLEKEEKKKLKKEMKAKRKEEKKNEGNDGTAADPKEKGTEKVKPSFQKAKKPTFSAPKQKPVEAALALPAPTPAEESSVSKEIGALIDEIVGNVDQTSMTTSECPLSTANGSVSADLQASPAKNIKKPLKPKFSIKTKDGHNLSESNIPNCTTSPPPVHASQDGLNALDEEASVDIAKILEVNTKQDSKETTEVDKESNSESLAFPLSQMTGKQLELLPKPGHQEDATSTRHPVNMEEAPSPVPQPAKEVDDLIDESTKILKTLNHPEIQECSPDPADWSEPDEPQTVPGQKRVMVTAVADGNDSDDSEPFDMEE